MAKWQKKFEKWKDAKSPIRRDEVETLLKRVFGDRLEHVEGTSHEYTISVPELEESSTSIAQQDLVFRLGKCGVPIKGGQEVLGFYVRRAYQVAELLKLYPPSQETEDEEDENEQDIDERSLE